MPGYYTPKRTRNLFDPTSKAPYRISRTKLDLFLNCPRCFYLDRRLGVERPPGYPFNLNNAVDTLLKKEFDIHREHRTPHPLMETYGIDAIPFGHEKIEEWRDSRRRGITYLHPKTNFNVTGGVDDVWVNPKSELIIVDYKATSKNGEVGIDADWQIGYRRQMEIYQWLFRKNGFAVSSTGYFVYVNGKTDRAAFDARLEFDIQIIPYAGDDSWVEQALIDAHECLIDKHIPPAGKECEFCAYRSSAASVEKPAHAEHAKSKKTARGAKQQLF